MTTNARAAVSLSKNWNGPDCVAISRSFCHVGLAAPFDYLGFLSRWRLRRRTPGPPPFSSINSTPARSKRLPQNNQGCTSRFGYTRFYLSNSHDTDSGVNSEILLAPIKEAARCPALCRRNH